MRTITNDKMLRNKNLRQKHTAIKWLTVKSEILMSTFKATYKILNKKVPEVLATKMKINNSNNRIGEHRKLGVKAQMANKGKNKHKMLPSQSIQVQHIA